MMDKLIVPPPFDGPWEANREGVLKAASGERLGYTRYDRIGDLARMQLASRFWAASPELANALVNIVVTADAALKAMYRGEDVTETAAHYKSAKAEAFAALERLIDPLIDPTKGINAPITAVIEAAKRGSA